MTLYDTSSTWKKVVRTLSAKQHKVYCTLINTILSNGAVVLVVLFQPELRAILEQMGRGAVLEPGQKKSAPDENSRVVQEIVQCCLDLSRRRVRWKLLTPKKLVI